MREGGSRRSRRTLGKESRVRKRREFLQIQNAGRRVATRHFLVVFVASGDGPARLGITVTRKVGNAVARNRIKRAVREAFRACAARLARGLSLVVIARDGASGLDCRSTTAELAPAFASLGVPQAPPAPSSPRVQ